ncbi:MAG: SidA/IucD/PvdA family monooxygenase [Aquabacterium sp.]
MSASPHAQSLAALERRLAWELEALQLPAARWTKAHGHEGQPVADVAIIGAGMAGLALAAACRLRGIDTLLLDESPAGFEGPWVTTARMETLRSPKQLAGPALGLPSLTFRAWYEAQFGSLAWEALDKIPRPMWMDYLRWYRGVLAIEVHNGHRVTHLQPRADGLVALDVAHAGQQQRRFARRVVIASGRDGLGGPWVPVWAQALPRERWAHSADALDHAHLAGMRVGVVGAGASAMDSAATALEAGAARVHLLVRRPDIPRINKSKGAGNPGFVHGHARLPDDWKWRLRRYIHQQQVPPPRGSTLRVSRQANAFFHLNCAVQGASWTGQALAVQTSAGPITLDFLFFATGFEIDLARRPWLAGIAPHVRLWGQRYTPPQGQEDAELAASPDLGPDFEFQARADLPLPGLDRVHCFCYPAALSHGTITGDIPAISEGAIQLATALVRRFHVEDIEHQFERMRAYDDPEVLGDEWVDSPLPTEEPPPPHGA